MEEMKQLSDDIKGAVVGFIILLCKGLLDDERWDWDVEKCDWNCLTNKESDWNHYQEGFCDPSILKTTISVFLNNLRVDDKGGIANYKDAKFRGFQYFRAMLGGSYKFAQVEPSFEPFEQVEPDWYKWEG
jgi:hypothetical protein